ncbi:MAG TPA: nucleotide sugar dehydrogenase [Verrucomicrobiae bacterium]|nr:nucleotide sugar dehydrogenase [Verrucomicrobiae bacterium]
MARKARERIEGGRAVVGILGLGYVGLPLALRFAEAGHPVIGFDIDARKVAKLQRGHSYINYISGSDVRQARRRGFAATTDFAEAKRCDALLICVPTPLTRSREPDLGFVVRTAEAIAPYLRRGQIVALESTTWPGTTEEILQPIMERSGLRAGRDFFLVFSPERQDPGNAAFDTRSIPKIVGGVTPACQRLGVSLYSRAIDQVVPVSSTRVAEMVKLLENIHRAVNIGLVNELKIVCDRMGIDLFEVIDAAATKPFGFVPYYPGPGLGGHCIPIDPFYLTWKAREFGLHTRFIELAGEINHAMPDWVIQRTTTALNRAGKPVRDARVLVLGIAYKKNVDDMRESPGVELIERLKSLGARVDYSDPHIPVFPRIRRAAFDMKSVALTARSLRRYDLVLLATNHDAFDYKLIARHARLIVDTRGVYRGRRAKVVKA